MKARFYMKTALILCLLKVIQAQEDPDDVSPQLNFALLQNVTQIVVQPQETYRLSLEQLFRGQHIDYRWELRYQNGTPVPPNITQDPLINVTEPLRVMKHIDLFQEETDQISLPQTSFIYKDAYMNRYLILIDYQMRLQIHDITFYYIINNTNYVGRDPIIMDLYVQGRSISPERDCNNLVLLNQTMIMAICRSDINAGKQNSISVGVYIDVSDIINSNVQVNYFISGLTYENLEDGTITMMSKMQNQGDYYTWIKENKTNCHLSLYRMSTNFFNDLILTIADFRDPNYNTHNLQETTNKKVQQQFLACGTPTPFDFNTNYIPSLTIRDIEVLPHFPDIIVATDYNYGILFWHINCLTERVCEAHPLYRLRQQLVGAICTLDLETEKTIFVTQMNPARIIEIDVSQRNSPPYVRRVYRLGGTQEFQYYALDVIDGNQDYILAELVNIQTFRPLIRVYQRQSTLFSSVYTELPLGDFIDSGLFMQFINPSQNFFILKTSNSFQIYKIQETVLEVNAWNVTAQQLLGVQTTQDIVLLNLTIIARNQTFHSLVTSLQLLFIDSNNVQTQAAILTDASLPIKYTCGDQGLQTPDIIDEYFSGKKNRLALAQNVEDNFFVLTRVGIDYVNARLFTTGECSIKTLVKFEGSRGPSLLNEYIACGVINGNRISFYNIISQDPEQESQAGIPDFRLPSSNILEFQYDQSKTSFFIASNMSARSNVSLAVIHIYKLYNIFSWEMTINLNLDVPGLQNFTYRSSDAMFFSPSVQQGLFTSEVTPIILTNGTLMNSQRIVVFEIKDAAGQAPFQIRGFIDILLISPLVVKHAQVGEGGFIWVLLTNGLMYIYQQIGPNVNAQPNNQYMNMQIIREYQSINLVRRTSGLQIENTTVINFHITNQQLIVFTGVNITVLHDFELASMTLQSSKILPLSQIVEDQIDLLRQLTFFISTRTNKIVYEIFGSYLFVLYNVFVNGFHSGYRFYVYDISKPRHNSLVMRYNVTVSDPRISGPDPLYLDPYFTRIQLFEIDETVIGVVLSINRDAIAYYRFSHSTQLSLNFDKFSLLNEKCRESENGLRLNVTVYPDDSPQQQINFTIIAENKGQLITKDQSVERLTIQVLEPSDVLEAPEFKSSKYSLLTNFQGQNMNYTTQCLEGRDTQNIIYNQQICDDVQVLNQVIEKNYSIDFLSSSNPAQAFFIFEPFLIFFDSRNVQIQHIFLQQYLGRDLSIIFNYLQTPVNGQVPRIEQFRLFDVAYNDQYSQISARYIMTLSSFNQVTLSRVYNLDYTKPQPMPISIRRNSGFQLHALSGGTVTNLLWIEFGRVYTTVFSKVAYVEMYPINPAIRDYLGAVFVYDNPSKPDLTSRIEIYTFDMRLSLPANVIQRNLTFDAIYAERLGMNVFKVTAVAVISESRVLVIGLRNLGLMFYSLDRLSIMKVELIRGRMEFQSLQITSIFPQSERHFKVLLKERGVITVTYPDTQQTLNRRISNPYLSQPWIQDSQGLQQEQFQSLGDVMVVSGTYGLAYTQLPTLQVGRSYDSQLFLRFFSSTIQNNSKAIGSYPYANVGQLCISLQTVVQYDFIRQIMPSVTNDSMVVAIVCDATLKFIAFNFQPSLLITLQNQYQMEISQTIIQINASNSQSADKFNLLITLLNQEKAMSTWIYFIVLLPIGIALLWLQQSGKNQHSEEKKDDNQEPPNKVVRQSKKEIAQALVQDLQSGRLTAKFGASASRVMKTASLEEKLLEKKGETLDVPQFGINYTDTTNQEEEQRRSIDIRTERSQSDDYIEETEHTYSLDSRSILHGIN